MSTDVKSEFELDIENMFKAYVKQVIIRSRSVFDRSNRVRNKYEELTFSAQTMEFSSSDDCYVENMLNIEKYCQINHFNIEFIFSDKKMYDIVKKLTKKQKKLLYLIYIANLTEQQIAAELHITRQAVNKIKNTALKEIKRKYIEIP